ncbi:MAG: hypothetical protein CMP91_03245 [Gammaproteobacteria bacterium]|nr:hypothetical protein [Gammaproteobacteria bacterium]MAY03004.1 hypothetical protein [Gammaproteobacteria bacterium]|tara:strand:+ start:580 stop:930 length:351 start_codon:yes stop_codon:yes gene_type:complete
MTDNNLSNEAFIQQLFQQNAEQQTFSHENSEAFVDTVMKPLRRQLWLRTAVLSVMAGLSSLILAFQLVPVINILSDSYNWLSFQTISINWELVLIPGSIAILGMTFLLMLDHSTDQ